MVNIPFLKRSAEPKPEKQPGNSVNKRQMIGYAGVAILAMGVFMPVYSLPLFGSFSYFAVSNIAGIVMLVLAVASAVIISIKKYKLLYVTGFLSLLLMVFSFLTLQSTLSFVTSGLKNSVLGNLLASSIQLQWGWIILLIGSIVITYTGETKIDQADKHDNAGKKETEIKTPVQTESPVKPDSKANIRKIISEKTNDPIVGTWYSEEKIIKADFYTNGTFDMINASRHDQADAYIGGTFNKDYNGRYLIRPQKTGKSKAEAQSTAFTEGSNMNFILQGNRIYEADENSIEFFRDV